MALGGIILGLVGLGFWIFVGSTVGLTWVNSQPQREIARTFIQHLSDSDIPAARSTSGVYPGSESDRELESAPFDNGQTSTSPIPRVQV